MTTIERTIERTVDELQDRLNAALLASDWATLNDLVARDACIIGPRGFMISRDEWIEVHRDTEYRLVRLDPVERTVIGSDRSGVRVDVVESECVYHGARITGRFRVGQCWATQDGVWRLASLQYTAVSEA